MRLKNFGISILLITLFFSNCLVERTIKQELFSPNGGF
jgi:hypothetical protein